MTFRSDVSIMGVMKKIQWHAVSKGAQVKSKPEATAMTLKCLIPGTWMGVVTVDGDWAYIISKQVIGWVLVSECGQYESNTLHIVRDAADVDTVAYIASVKRAS